MTQPDTGAPPRSDSGVHGAGRPEPRPDATDADDMRRPVQDGGAPDAGERPDAGGGPVQDGAAPDAGGRPVQDGGAAPDAGERPDGGASPDAGGQQGAGERPDAGGSPDDARPQRPTLPPGQYIPRTLPVLHYGPVPVFNPETWDLKIFGSTETGAEAKLGWDEVAALPVSEVVADFHCVTKFTVLGVRWAGVLASEILRRYPPAAQVTHVMIWADFGYSANIRITDFAAETTLLATHREGERLTPEHGYPLRFIVPHLYGWKSVKWIRALEYLTKDRRGFWEERGYHNTADPWREQRYSYQETEGEGPPL